VSAVDWTGCRSAIGRLIQQRNSPPGNTTKISNLPVALSDMNSSRDGYSTRFEFGKITERREVFATDYSEHLLSCISDLLMANILLGDSPSDARMPVLFCYVCEYRKSMLVKSSQKAAAQENSDQHLDTTSGKLHGRRQWQVIAYYST